MPKLTIALDDAGTTHEVTDKKNTIGREKPADFANASPFPSRKKEQDKVALAIYAAAAIAILAMLLSLLNLLQLQPPM